MCCSDSDPRAGTRRVGLSVWHDCRTRAVLSLGRLRVRECGAVAQSAWRARAEPWGKRHRAGARKP